MLLLSTALLLGRLAFGVPQVETIKLPECTYKRIPLFGRVTFVDAQPELRIQIVKTRSDFRVRRVRVPLNPKACGVWRIVKTGGLRVQIVKTHPDLRVEFVEETPGVPSS